MAKRKVRIYKDPNGKGEYRSNLKNFLFLAQAGGAPQQAAPQQGAQQQGMSPAEQEQLYNYVYDSLDIDQADPQMLFETLTKQGMDPNLVKTIIELSIKRITEGRSSADSEKALAQAEIEREEALAERKRLEQEQQEAAAAKEQLLIDEMNQDSSMSEGVNEDDQVDEMIESMDDNQEEEVVEETVEEDIPDSQEGGDVINIPEVTIDVRKPGFGSEKFTKEDKQAAREAQFTDLAKSLLKDNPNMTQEEFLEKYKRLPEYKNLTLDQLANFFKNRKQYRTEARDARQKLERKQMLWDKYHTPDGKVDTDKIGLADWSRMYVREGLAEVDPNNRRGFGPGASYDGLEALYRWKKNPFSALGRGLTTGDFSYQQEDLPDYLGGTSGDFVDQTKTLAAITAMTPFAVGPAAGPSTLAFGAEGLYDLGNQVADKLKDTDSEFNLIKAALNTAMIFPFMPKGIKNFFRRGRVPKGSKVAKDGIEDLSYLEQMTGETVGTTTGKTTSTSTGKTSKRVPFKDLSTRGKLWRIGKYGMIPAGFYAADKYLSPIIAPERPKLEFLKRKLTPAEEELMKDKPASYEGTDIEGKLKELYPDMPDYRIKDIMKEHSSPEGEKQLRENIYNKEWLERYSQTPSSSPLPMETMARRGGVISKKQYVKQGMKNFEAGGQEINNATPWNVNNETGTREAQKNVLVNYAQTNVAKDQEKKRLEAEYDAMMAQQQQMYNPPIGEEIIDMTNMQEEVPSAQFGGGKQRRMLRRATRPIRKMMRRGMMMPGVSEINVTKSGIFGNPKEYSMTIDPAYSGLMGMMGNPMMMMQGMLSSMGMPYQYTVPFITQSNKANTTTKAEKEIQMRNGIPDIEKQGRMASDYAGHDPVIGETLQAYFARTGRGGDEYMEAFSEEDMTKTWSGDDWKLPGAQSVGNSPVNPTGKEDAIKSWHDGWKDVAEYGRKGKRSIQKRIDEGMTKEEYLKELKAKNYTQKELDYISNYPGWNTGFQQGGFTDSSNPDLYKFVYGGDEDVYQPGGITVTKETNYLGQGPKLYNEEDYNNLNVVYADPNNPEAAFKAGDRFGAKTLINYSDGSSESYDIPTVYMSPLSARKPVDSYDQTLQNWMMNNIRTGDERNPGDTREEVLYDNQSLGKPFKGETKGEYYQRVGGDEGLEYMIDTYDLNPDEIYKKGGFPDLTGDGKVTRADILKGRGVFKEGGSYDNPGFKALPLSVQQKIMQQKYGGELDEYQKAGATQFTVSGADVGPNAKRPVVDYTQQQAGDPRLDPALGMMSPTQEVQDQRAKEQQRISSNNTNLANPNPNSRISPEQMKMLQQQLMQNYQNSMRGMRYPSMGRGRNLFGNFMSANPAFSYAGSYAQPIYNKRSGSPFMGMVPPGANLQKIDVTKSGIFGRPKRWTATYGTGAPKLYGVDDDGNRVSSEEQDTRSRAERKTDNLLNRKERRAENKYERNRRRAMKKGVGDGMLSYREQKAEEAEIARQEELDYQNAIDNVQDDVITDAEMEQMFREEEEMNFQEDEARFAKEQEDERNAAMADIDQKMKFGKTGNFGSAATGKSYNAFSPGRITTPVNVKGQGRGQRVLMDGSDATTFNPTRTGMPTLQNRNPERPFNANMLQNQIVGPMGTDDNTGIYEGEGNPFIQAMGTPGSMAYGGPMIDDEVEMTEEEIRMFVMGGGVVEYI